MKEELISVIVPVYNVEKYLNKCVRSIVESDYRNLQIILVDDGSTDQSSSLCDAWEKLDDRIKVIHKKNGGLSSARNEGLKYSNGKYISFIDSDDYIHQRMFSYLYESLKNDNSDVAICGVEEFNENGEYRRFRSVDEKIILSEKEAVNQIFTGSLMIAVMNRLYRKEVLSNIQFAEGRLYEDVIFDTDLFLKNNNQMKISVLPNTGYYYLRRSNSIMGQTENKSPSTELFFAYDYLFKYVKRYNSNGMNKIVAFVTYYLMSFIYNDKVKCTKEYEERLKKYLIDYSKYIRISEVGMKYKLKLFIYRFFK